MKTSKKKKKERDSLLVLTLWEDARDTFECSALRVECVTTAAYLTSHSLYSLSHRGSDYQNS